MIELSVRRSSTVLIEAPILKDRRSPISNQFAKRFKVVVGGDDDQGQVESGADSLPRAFLVGSTRTPSDGGDRLSQALH